MENPNIPNSPRDSIGSKIDEVIDKVAKTNDKSNDKVLVNPSIHIEGNIIASENNLIQISNISRIWAGQVPKKTMSRIMLGIVAFLFVGGFTSLYLPSSGSKFFGLLLLTAAGFLIYKHVTQTKFYAVNFEMNSNVVYSYTSDVKEHVDSIFGVLKRIIIENNEATNMLINFGDGTIINNSDNVNAAIKEDLVWEKL